jgi:XTP/dITP diphosphohydrolase
VSRPGRRFVLATGNPGKAREITALLAPLDMMVVAQSELAIEPVDETGATFIENAILKARHAAAASGLAAIADDSGLVVDALAGEPGIHSARYAGGGGDDANIRKLLCALDGVPPVQRKARFVCIAVLLHHAADPLPLVCEGRWEGDIAMSPRGELGFGYDPVFIPGGDTRTAAELDPGEKNRLSHRGRAFAQMVARLRAGASPALRTENGAS